MNKKYQTPIIEIIEFESNVKTQNPTEGPSGMIDYPWQTDESGGLFE